MHTHTLRIYYEDTDLGGVVYHANYLKFMERGRSEFVRALGFDQVALKRDHGIFLAVRRVDIDYLRPALYDDLLTVTTAISAIGGASATLLQEVLRDEAVLARATVVVVAMDADGKPHRLPEGLRAAFGAAPSGG